MPRRPSKEEDIFNHAIQSSAKKLWLANILHAGKKTWVLEKPTVSVDMTSTLEGCQNVNGNW